VKIGRIGESGEIRRRGGGEVEEIEEARLKLGNVDLTYHLTRLLCLCRASKRER